MDEDNLNLEIRKFLKQVGISSQREIENYIRKKFTEGKYISLDNYDKFLFQEQYRALSTLVVESVTVTLPVPPVCI